MSVLGANNIIEQELRSYVQDIEQDLDADVITIMNSIIPGLDDIVRDNLEILDDKRDKICVILETVGGSIETTQRIAETLRHHYRKVEFIVPNYAMSAGTILVMCGDEIYMDYYSVLGPIDPQVPKPGAGLVPALGYLIQYERLISKADKGDLNTAELNYLMQRFDPAELYRFEQARNLSISLLKEWLVKYKFKNWRKTNSRGKNVTKAMKTARASAVAKTLNDTERWHTHGRGISKDVVIKDLRLKVTDFGSIEPLNGHLKTYYKLIADYMQKSGHAGVIHTRMGYQALSG